MSKMDPLFLMQFADLEKQYEILKKLGEGAYGVVAAAKDRSTGENVAIKRIRDAVEDDDQVPLPGGAHQLVEPVFCLSRVLNGSVYYSVYSV